ncbi:histidinol-phosphatase HisJ family protein [Adlercreutzia sp. ZJ138]|uniref:histidinol-phosphatase HisJ family protein n=1 Tax=Adlercreutzia sp. ZJ138 TaxID=2709405 RepID=UPI0013EDAFFF|nr:histidinol-phosphatase HisJ family protein [Adlercreutzia sp. ZJ138]
MELINMHCHSKYCGHGEGEVEEYAVAAEAAGLSALAFTEHFPLTLAFDPDRYLSVPAERMPDYLRAVEEARAAHPSLEIITGCELDWLGTDDDRNLVSADFDPFVHVLLSVHFVDRWAFDDPAQRDAWEQPGAPERIWRRYVELWCDAVSSDVPFTAMSHPDLAKKFAYYPSFDLTPLYQQMAEACAAAGKMIEVNTSGSYYACAQMFPAPELLREFCRAGVPCTVGTDAHKPEHVARDIEHAYAYMYEAGYRVVTVPTATGDRRTITIE